MDTFFYVTYMLFNSIYHFFGRTLGKISVVMSGFATLLCIIILICFFKGKKKEFYIKYKVFVYIFLIVIAVSSLFTREVFVLKYNFFLLSISLIVVFVNLTKKESINVVQETKKEIEPTTETQNKTEKTTKKKIKKSNNKETTATKKVRRKKKDE